jgi:hypothetical protein
MALIAERGSAILSGLNCLGSLDSRRLFPPLWRIKIALRRLAMREATDRQLPANAIFRLNI